MIGLLIGAAVASSIIGEIGDTAQKIYDNRMNDMYDAVLLKRDAVSFHEQNYMDVIRVLLEAGFTDINTVEIRKYKSGFFTKGKYGKVESVSINGNNAFTKKTRFSRNAHVVVSFHVFKDSPPVVIPELQRRMQSVPQVGYPYQQPFNINVNIDNSPSQSGYQQPMGRNYPFFNPDDEKYCGYCNSLIPNNAGFCPRCGAPVGSRNR